MNFKVILGHFKGFGVQSQLVVRPTLTKTAKFAVPGA